MATIQSATEYICNQNNEFKDYIDLEKTLKQTLVSAQKTSQELKGNAEKESELIIKEAELKAERIVQEARSEAKTLIKEIQQLRKQKRLFKLEIKNLLDAFKEILVEEEKGTLNKSKSLEKTSNNGMIE